MHRPFEVFDELNRRVGWYDGHKLKLNKHSQNYLGEVHDELGKKIGKVTRHNHFKDYSYGNAVGNLKDIEYEVEETGVPLLLPGISGFFLTIAALLLTLFFIGYFLFMLSPIITVCLIVIETIRYIWSRRFKVIRILIFAMLAVPSSYGWMLTAQKQIEFRELVEEVCEGFDLETFKATNNTQYEIEFSTKVGRDITYIPLYPNESLSLNLFGLRVWDKDDIGPLKVKIIYHKATAEEITFGGMQRTPGHGALDWFTKPFMSFFYLWKPLKIEGECEPDPEEMSWLQKLGIGLVEINFDCCTHDSFFKLREW